MKKKLYAIISIAVCLLMVISVMTACSFKKPESTDDTTLSPDPSWLPGTDGSYQPVDISDVELVAIVSEALGDEAKDFDGNLGSLSKEQLDKVKDVAKDNGYIVEGDSIKKDPDLEAGEADQSKVNEIYSEANVTEKGTVNDKQYSEISSAAKDNGATAVTDKKGNVNIITTTKTTTTAPSTTAGTPSGTQQSTVSQPGNSSTTEKKPTVSVEIPSSAKPTTTLKTTTYKGKVTTAPYTGDSVQTVPVKVGQIKASGGNTYGNGAHVFFAANTATSDGVISAGNTTKGTSSYSSGLIVKLDAAGNKKWEDTLKADDLTKYDDVCTLSDGSVIAVGETIAENIVPDSQYKCKGTAEGVIVKYSAAGQRQWIKLVGGSGADMIYAVAPTSDGGFVIAGETESKDFDFKDATKYANNGFVAKCDANGNIIWKKTMGGTKNCAVKDVAVTSSGTIYTVAESLANDGDFKDLERPNSNRKYTVVCKYKPDGTREWVRTYYDVGIVTLGHIATANDNGCVIAGSYSAGKTKNENSFLGIYNGGPAGTADGMVVKISSTGDTVWRTPLIGFENDIITDITPINGGYAVTGYSTSTNRDFAFGNNGDYDSFIAVISNGGKLNVISGFGGSESDRAQAICSSGSSVYSSGTSLSDDVSFASCSYKSDGTNAMGFAMRFDLVES